MPVNISNGTVCLRCNMLVSHISVVYCRSVALLMQVAIPCALFAPGPTTFSLWGGTDAEFAPPINYMAQVMISYAMLCGYDMIFYFNFCNSR